MADRIEFELEGAQELLVKLKGVSVDIQTKGGRFALRRAGKIIEEAVIGDAMRINRERSKEAIFRNIKLRFSPKLFQRTGDLGFRIGVLGGAVSRTKNEANPGGDTWYWRLLEFGTEKMRAQPFMRPAIERVQGRVRVEFILQYRKALDRALRKAEREKGKVTK